MALSSASSFVRNCDKCQLSVLPSGVTELVNSNGGMLVTSALCA